MTFPESGSRIAAAARVIARWGMYEDMPPDKDDYLCAEQVLAAADAVEAGIAEKLAAALSMAEVEIERAVTANQDAWTDATLGRVRAALAEFEKLRASAPVESPE